MKRRGFLTLFGAAVATPLLPGAGMAGATRNTFAVAVAHAQKFPVVSVAGLSARGNLSTTQAEAMIRKLASEGMVKLVGPSKSGTVRAASRILANDKWHIATAAHERRMAQRRAAEASTKARPAKSDIAPWIAHLHDLCRRQGMALNPRCFA